MSEKIIKMFCVCIAYRQRLPTLSAFYQSGKQADFIGLPRTLAGFQLVHPASRKVEVH